MSELSEQARLKAITIIVYKHTLNLPVTLTQRKTLHQNDNPKQKGRNSYHLSKGLSDRFHLRKAVEPASEIRLQLHNTRLKIENIKVYFEGNSCCITVNAGLNVGLHTSCTQVSVFCPTPSRQLSTQYYDRPSYS